MRPLLELPAFDITPVATTVKTCKIDKLPQGYIYDAIILELTSDDGAFTYAHLDEISVRLGAKDIVEQLSGTQLRKINAYYGLGLTEANTRTYVCIPFANIKAREYEAMRIGAVDTKSYNYNEFSLTVKTTASQTGTTLSLKAYGLLGGEKPTEDGEGRPMDTRAIVRALLKSTKSMTIAGDNEFTFNPGTSPSNLIRAAHLFNTYITDLAIKKDRVNVWDKMSKYRIQAVQTEAGRTIQSGHLAFDCVLYGDEFEALSMMRNPSDWANPKVAEMASFLNKATCSQSDTGVVIVSDIYTTVAGL